MKRPILVFFLFFYFVPAIFVLNYTDFVNIEYRGNVYYSSLIYASIFFLLTYQFSKIKLNIPNFKQLKILAIFFNKNIEWLFILSFFITSLVFFNLYGLEFRQTGVNISVGGAVIYLNYITKAYVKCFIFKQIICISDENYKVPKLKLILVFLSSLLATSAALDILIPIFIIVLFIKKSLIYKDTKQVLPFYFFILIIVITVPIIGTANKIGFHPTYVLFTENYDFVLKSVLRRIATWYHSINIYLDIVYYEIIPNFLDLIKDIFKTSVNRFAIIFGYDRDIPEINTAARFNYLNLFWDTSNPKTGATSGIVATSLLFFPFGLFFFSFILGKFYKYVYKLIPKKTSYFTDFFILLVIITPLVSSPLDLIIILSPETFFFFFLVCLKYHNIQNNSFNEKNINNL